MRGLAKAATELIHSSAAQSQVAANVPPEQLPGITQINSLTEDGAQLCGRRLKDLPPIYVIHLSSNKERGEFLKTTTDPEVLPFLRWRPGVDLRQMGEQDLVSLMKDKGWNIHPKSTQVIGQLGYAGDEVNESPRKVCDIWRGRAPTTGSMGNSLALHSLWEEISKEHAGPGWALFTEDDRAINDASKLCSFFDAVEKLPRNPEGKPLWDMINLSPADGGSPTKGRYSGGNRTASESLPHGAQLSHAFRRVRAPMSTSVIAVTNEFAAELSKAGLPQCLVDSDDVTTFACDPKSHPEHEALGTCFPDLAHRQRVCLLYNGEKFYAKPQGKARESGIDKSEQSRDMVARVRDALGQQANGASGSLRQGVASFL